VAAEIGVPTSSRHYVRQPAELKLRGYWLWRPAVRQPAELKLRGYGTRVRFGARLRS